MSLSNSATFTAWNGPICGTGYLGSHRCSREDIARRIAELARLMDATDAPANRTAGCPCRPENGGSGVCGCIMGGATITCSVA
jgi:hypothetical protein